MKYLLSLSLLFVLFACNNVTNSDTDTTTTTDSTAQNNTVANPNEIALKLFSQQKETIEKGLAEGAISEYTVKDGAGFVAESTTYYTNAEKTVPCLTKIIYKTGGFANVYWLNDGTIWVEKDDYSHVFQKGSWLFSLSDNQITEISESDKADAAEVSALAVEIISSKS